MSDPISIISARPRYTSILRVTACVIGASLGFGGWFIAGDPIGQAIWGIACIVLLLPIAYRGDSGPRAITERNHVDAAEYTLACGAALITVALRCGVPPAITVAAVAFSLLGGLLLLSRIGVPTPLGIGWLLVQSGLFLTWPIWAANLLVKHESQWLVDLLVKIGPIFAVNGCLDPTDAFTHHPLAYRLMNLGQDIPYEMPRTIWPSVLAHVAAGLPGFLLTWRDRNRHSPRANAQ